jgi:hypothetical protein
MVRRFLMHSVGCGAAFVVKIATLEAGWPLRYRMAASGLTFVAFFLAAYWLLPSEREPLR